MSTTTTTNSVEAAAHRLCILANNDDSHIMSYISSNRDRYACISIQDRIPQLMLVVNDVTLFPSSYDYCVPPVVENIRISRKIRTMLTLLLPDGKLPSNASSTSTCIVRINQMNDICFVSPVVSFILMVEIMLLIIDKDDSPFSVLFSSNACLMEGMIPFLQLVRISNYDILARLTPTTTITTTKATNLSLNLCGFFVPNPVLTRNTTTTTSKWDQDDDFKIALSVAQLTLSRHQPSPGTINVLNVLHLIRLYLESYATYRHAIISTSRGNDVIENKLFNGTAATTFARLQAVSKIDTNEIRRATFKTETPYWSAGCLYYTKEDVLLLLSVYGNYAVCSSLTNSPCRWFMFVPGMCSLNVWRGNSVDRVYDVQWKGGQFGSIVEISDAVGMVNTVTRETILDVYQCTETHVSGFAFALLSWFLPSTIPGMYDDVHSIDMKNISNENDGLIEEISEEDSFVIVDDLLEYERSMTSNPTIALELNSYANMAMNKSKWVPTTDKTREEEEHRIFQLIDWCVAFEVFINVLCFCLRGGSPDFKPAKVHQSSTRVKRVLSYLPLFAREIKSKNNKKEDVIGLIVSFYNEVNVSDLYDSKVDGDGVMGRYMKTFTLRCEMFGSNTSTLVSPSEIPVESKFKDSPFKWLLYILHRLLDGFGTHDYRLNRQCLGMRVPFWTVDTNNTNVCIGQSPKTDTCLQWKRMYASTTHSHGMHPVVASILKGIVIEPETKQALVVLFTDSYRTQSSSILKRSDSIQDSTDKRSREPIDTTAAYDPEAPGIHKRQRID